MNRPRLFAELCAGTAAVSLCLQGGRHCRPPISRMGSKSGYALSILDLLGLRPGQGAETYLFAEPDPGVRGMLAAYPDPVALRAIAETIRGWIPCPYGHELGGDACDECRGPDGRSTGRQDARRLWERLRAEGPAAGVAGWMFLHHGSFCYKGPEAGIGRPEGNPGEGGFGVVRPSLDILLDAATRLSTLRWPPVAIAPDARGVDLREVARWMWLAGHSNPYGNDVAPPYRTGAESNETWKPPPPDWLAARADRLASVAWPPVLVAPDAREVSVDGDLSGCVAYIDPPYQNTTGYAADLPRADVIALARRWHEAGATVLISEAEPVEGLGSGWEAVEITAGRKGQKRTFSVQQSEWVTMNRPPVYKVAAQVGLFGGA